VFFSVALFQAALDISKLIEQVPFVILIIYVIELRDKRWQAMMKERDEQWQRFLDTQELRHKEAMAAVAKALGDVAEQTSETHQLMAVHDQRVVNALPKMQEVIRGQSQGST
jgi:tRNA G10  N-methylase Trm11